MPVCYKNGVKKRYNKSETDHEKSDSTIVSFNFQNQIRIKECPKTYFGIVAEKKF